MKLHNDEADRALLARLVDQDQSALADLFVRFQQPLYSYLIRVMGNAEEAEDIFQEVLLAVWQGAKTFRGQARVSSWVFGIAHHLALKAWRQTKHSQETMGLEMANELPADEQAPEDQAIALITYEALETGLQQLTSEHREILLLAFYYDFSCKEIAEIIDVPEGTVKSRISYARRTLKAMLWSHQVEVKE